jgi:hypothetical protein
MTVDRYVDPVRALRLRVNFLLATTILFAALAVIAANKCAGWRDLAIKWQFQALTGGRGDGL